MRRTQGRSPGGNAGTGDTPPPGPLSGSIKSAILIFRSPGRTDRTAVDAGRFDPNVDQAVETRITAFQSPIACLFAG